MYATPKEASKHYEVSTDTLCKWANSGKIKCSKTKGGHRRYWIPNPDEPDNPTEPHTIPLFKQRIIYARVSSGKQRMDLSRQTESLREKYPTHTIVTDIGSGINFERPGFRKILDGLFKGTIQEVVVAHEDRFTRFGYDLFAWIFQKHNAELICDSRFTQSSPETELSEDLMAIVTVFAARHHGRRRRYTCGLQQESEI
jgi:predicted site-specific integrase-resolvase